VTVSDRDPRIILRGEKPWAWVFMFEVGNAIECTSGLSGYRFLQGEKVELCYNENINFY
jgi:hypothetical protein